MKVPYVSQQQVNLPGPTLAPTDTSGGRAIASVQQGVNKAAEIYAKRLENKRKEQDALDLLEAQREFGDLEREHFTAEMQKRGADAEGMAVRTTAFYQQVENQYGSRFKNRPELNVKWREILTRSRDSGLTTAAHYEAQQGVVARRSAAEGLVANKIGSAGIFAYNPSRIAQELQEIENGVKALNPGVDVTAQVLKGKTAYLDSVFQKLASEKNIFAMQQFLERFQDQMPGGLLNHLKTQYEAIETDFRQQGIYNDVLRASDGDFGEAIKNLRDPNYRPDIEGPDRRAVISMISGVRSETKLQQAEAEKEAAEKHHKGLLGLMLQSKLTVDSINATGLDTKGKLAWMDIKRAADDRARRAAKEALTEKDRLDELYANARLTAKYHETGITLTDILTEARYMSPGLLNRWSERLEKQKNEYKKTGYQQHFNYFTAAKEKAKVLFEDDQDAYQQFVVALDAEMEARDIPAKHRDVMQIADMLLISMQQKDSWLDTVIDLFKVGAATGIPGYPSAISLNALTKGMSQKGINTIRAISEEDRRRMANQLEAKGLPVTGPNMLHLYNQMRGASE